MVVLTRGGPFGELALQALRARGVVPAAVLVETRSAFIDCFHRRSRLGRLAELPLVPLRAVWRRVRPRTRRGLRVGAPLFVSGALDSERLRRDLLRLDPDLLVLAGCGIISAELLALPRLGVLNAHPGLLPWVRGNGVVAHAILRGIPIGASCHVVDTGIDTGPVFHRRMLRVTGADRSLRELELANDALAVRLLADVVAETVRHGGLPPATVQRERFPLCRWLSPERRAEVDELVRAGRARELFEEWVALAGEGTSLDLAPTFVGPPRANVDLRD